jgi:DNA-directed RNA polymerase specialized sigma24 family protein
VTSSISDCHATTVSADDTETAAESNDDDPQGDARIGLLRFNLRRASAVTHREASTLVELEGITAREAAEMVGVSVSCMESRVQRGGAQLRQLFEACREIALDARGKVIDYAPRARDCTACK